MFTGLVFGSFATALIYRVPRDISWVTAKNKEGTFARSACPHCDHDLGFKDLIPVFSWLLSKGKCRYCRESIAFIYPAAEILCCIACFGIYFTLGFTVESILILLGIPFLVALLFIDIQTFRLPNQLVFIIGILGALHMSWAAFSLFQDHLEWMDFIISKLSGMLVFSFLIWGIGKIVSAALKKPSLGFGDVKFYAVAGLWLGLSYLPIYMIMSGVIGVLWGAGHTQITKSKVFPFGPALILAFYICLILQGASVPILAYN